jgi:hypothetical protein
MPQLAIGDYLIVHDEGLVKFHDVANGATHCLRPTEMGLLFELLDGVSWERRRAARIPVTESDCLNVIVEIGKHRYAVVPIDISNTGILVCWNTAKSSVLNPMNEVIIHLEFRGKQVVVNGQVRRIDGAKVGIGFCIPDDEPDESTRCGVESIFDMLETKWVEQRIFGRATRTL